jgi:hypothetical protein
MARFIKTSTKDGMSFTLNLDQIVTIHKEKNHSKVITSTGKEMELSISYEEMNSLVEAKFT